MYGVRGPQRGGRHPDPPAEGAIWSADANHAGGRGALAVLSVRPSYRFTGFARPTQISMPSPPGLPTAPPIASMSKFGFQLLQVQTLPAASMLTPVVRIIGMWQGGPSSP